MTRRVRRTRYLFLSVDDRPTPDVAALLSGTARLTTAPALTALSLVRGAEYPLSTADLALLAAIPSTEWKPVDELDDPAQSRLERLADLGLVFVDPAEPEHAALRDAEEAIAATGWHPRAALVHRLSRWRGVGDEGAALDEELINRALHAYVEHQGPPPPALHTRPEARDVLDLPVTHPDADLFATLLARRSTRAFDRQATVSAEELATVLRFTFGAHGHVQAHPEVDAVGKTSPSAGGLHPIEAYPLVMRVDGVPVGLYHYDAGRHALELLEPLDVHAAEELAVVFGAGQPWMSEPAFVCVLTARFGRTFWKYRRHERAFTVVLMDAAHMGQTFQLLCTALGLGTLFTAAINAADIDERLGIDGIKEGALAALLCGHAAPGRTPLEPAFEPFEPRRPPPPT